MEQLQEVKIESTSDSKRLATDSVYEMLFDTYGQVKTNIGKRAVVRG
jgi:hypothetical protein